MRRSRARLIVHEPPLTRDSERFFLRDVPPRRFGRGVQLRRVRLVGRGCGRRRGCGHRWGSLRYRRRNHDGRCILEHRWRECRYRWERTKRRHERFRRRAVELGRISLGWIGRRIDRRHFGRGERRHSRRRRPGRRRTAKCGVRRRGQPRPLSELHRVHRSIELRQRRYRRSDSLFVRMLDERRLPMRPYVRLHRHRAGHPDVQRLYAVTLVRVRAGSRREPAPRGPGGALAGAPGRLRAHGVLL